MPRDVFVRYTGDTRATTAALWLERRGARRGRRTNPGALQRDGSYEVAVPREIRRLSLRVFDRTFAVTYLLEAVAVLIGLFGISASTSSQVLARRGEFGMLRHLGVTRGEIGRMLASRARRWARSASSPDW
jgi:putative ABC transport system permease protein